MSQGHYHNVKLKKSKHIDTLKKCNYLKIEILWADDCNYIFRHSDVS